MKQLYILAVLLCALPLSAMAQDDLYFTPKKKAQASADTEPAYYVGSNRDVDEYNRRGKYWSHYQKLGNDSLGNDIIQFQQGNGVYPDSVYVDTTFVAKYRSNAGDDDFAYSRRMSRWDGYYDPWLYSYRYSYGYSPYYWRSAWYDPWYSDPFYDPWYPRYYGYYGWYNPYYYAGWGWPGYYHGWGWPGYWGGVYVTHSGSRGGYAGYRSWGGTQRQGSGRSVAYGQNGTRSFGGRNSRTYDNRTFGNRNNPTRQDNYNFGGRPSTPSMPSGSFGGGFGGSRGGGFGGGHTGGGGGGRFGGGHR